MKAGKPPKFLADELRPLAFCYAPSLMALEALKARRSINDNQARTLLSLARPDFSSTTRNRSPVARHYLEILGVEALSDLRESEAESNGVCEAFGRDRSRQLLRKTATEAALRKELRMCPTFLHLATHGIAPDTSALGTAEEALPRNVKEASPEEINAAPCGNVALALAMPAERPLKQDQDGFLELSEIYGLRLGNCELVALSSCSTNVGLRQPLEMGATLSRAFLSAGARRVVASQWPVPDKSTAELIGATLPRDCGSRASGQNL